MAQFELDAEKVAQSATTLKKISEEQKEKLEGIAKAVINMPESPQKDDVLTGGKKIQEKLNAQLDGVNTTIQSMQAVVDIATYMEKYSAEAHIETGDASEAIARAATVNVPTGF